ncbi:MAG: hypothetical protein CV087_07515 [Candidatus Brocadia sp. WS118]|nr:MAG: hypothetical protein CV087_07515 [Candidatus Brocadia sp. WS118]
MPSKIINTLILLTGPVIMALTQVWGLILPVNLGDLIIAVLNMLLLIIGGTVTVVKGIPALFRLAPRNLVEALRQNL